MNKLIFIVGTTAVIVLGVAVGFMLIGIQRMGSEMAEWREYREATRTRMNEMADSMRADNKRISHEADVRLIAIEKQLGITPTTQPSLFVFTEFEIDYTPPLRNVVTTGEFQNRKAVPIYARGI